MTTRRIVATTEKAVPGLPLSQAVVVGGLVFVSGQIAPDVEGVAPQTRVVLEKLGTILRAAGSDYSLVARCGIFLIEPSDFDPMNQVYREFFPEDPPARSTIFCKLAYPHLRVEIDCVAEVR